MKSSFASVLLSLFRLYLGKLDFFPDRMTKFISDRYELLLVLLPPYMVVQEHTPENLQFPLYTLP